MRLGLGLGLNRPIYTGVQPSAISDLVAANAADIPILVVGDSTGDNTTEWPYLFAQKMYVPTHTVTFRFWNDGAGSYDAPVTLSRGTGPRSIHFYNASVGGSRGQYFLGAKFAAAIAAVAAKAIIFNFGINSNAAGSDLLMRGELVSAIAQIHKQHPTARLFGIKQNPNRDSTIMTALVAQWDVVAGLLPGLTLVNVHQAFLDLGKPGTLYTDAIHPNAAGSAVYVSMFQAAWYAGVKTAATPWLNTAGANLITNYDFSAWVPPALPTNWTEPVATLTEDKELTIKHAGESFSVKLFDNGAVAFTRLSNFLSAAERDAIRGQTITIWTWVYIPIGMPQGAGRLSFAYASVGSGALSATTRTETQGQGGWRLLCLPGIVIPADATTPNVVLYYDSGVPSVADNVYWARRVRFHLGATPKEVGVAA